MAALEVVRNKVPWNYRSTNEGGGKNLTKIVKIPTFDNRQLVDDYLQQTGEDRNPLKVPVLIFAGNGHGKRILNRVVTELGNDGVHAIGVHFPFSALPTTMSAIEAGAREMPHVVADRIVGDSGEKLPTLAHSVGCGIHGIALDHRPDGAFGNTAWLQPAGLHIVPNQLLRPQEELDEIALKTARDELFGRFMQIKPAWGTLEDARTMRDVGARFIADVATRHLKPQLDFFNTHSIQEAAVTHADNGNRMLIMPTKEDPVVLYLEALAALESTGRYPHPNIRVQIPEGIDHTGLSLRDGKKLREKGIIFLKNAAAGTLDL